MFTVARELRRDGKPVDLVTLGGLMGGDPLGGAASILDSVKRYSTADELPDAISVEDSLVNLYARRRMLGAGESLSGSALNYAAKPADVIETTVRDLEDIRVISQPAYLARRMSTAPAPASAGFSSNNSRTAASLPVATRCTSAGDTDSGQHKPASS